MTDRHYKHVIVLGAARSGTKFLRDVLAAIPVAAVVPYDINFVWRYGNEKHTSDCLARADFTPRIGDQIRRSIDRIAVRHNREITEMIIEKTVSNTLRVGFVHEVFPDAQFIHLIRDGRDVVESAYRQWKSKPDIRYLMQKLQKFSWRNPGYAYWYIGNLLHGLLGYGRGVHLWGPRYEGIERDVSEFDLASVCGLQWRKCVDSTLNNLQNLAMDRQITIRYEDFVASTAPLSELLSFLNVCNREVVEEEYDRRVRRGYGGQWDRTFSDEQKKLVSEIIDTTRIRLGYA